MSSAASHDTRFSLSKPIIEKEAEYEVIDFSIATSKSLRFLLCLAGHLQYFVFY